jgi:hypothetical protein
MKYILIDKIPSSKSDAEFKIIQFNLPEFSKLPKEEKKTQMLQVIEEFRKKLGEMRKFYEEYETKLDHFFFDAPNLPLNQSRFDEYIKLQALVLNINLKCIDLAKEYNYILPLANLIIGNDKASERKELKTNIERIIKDMNFLVKLFETNKYEAKNIITTSPSPINIPIPISPPIPIIATPTIPPQISSSTRLAFNNYQGGGISELLKARNANWGNLEIIINNYHLEYIQKEIVCALLYAYNSDQSIFPVPIPQTNIMTFKEYEWAWKSCIGIGSFQTKGNINKTIFTLLRAYYDHPEFTFARNVTWGKLYAILYPPIYELVKKQILFAFELRFNEPRYGTADQIKKMFFFTPTVLKEFVNYDHIFTQFIRTIIRNQEHIPYLQQAYALQGSDNKQREILLIK